MFSKLQSPKNTALIEVHVFVSSPVYQAPAEGAGGIFGTSTVEAMGTAEVPRPPLSRSLPGGKNPVSVLMEYSQRSGNPIEFIITGQAGPPHDPRYRLPSPPSESVIFGCCSPPHCKFLLREAVDQLFLFNLCSVL